MIAEMLELFKRKEEEIFSDLLNHALDLAMKNTIDLAYCALVEATIAIEHKLRHDYCWTDVNINALQSIAAYQYTKHDTEFQKKMQEMDIPK